MATTIQKRKRKRYVIAAMLTLAIGLTLALASLFTLTRMEPAHWKAHRAFIETTSPQERQALASQARDKIAVLSQSTTARVASSKAGTADKSLTQTVTPQKSPTQTTAPPTIDARETITFTHEQINALIDEELAAWARNAGYNMPSEITDPMVDYVSGRYVMAFAYRSPNYTQVISAYFDLQFTPEGTAIIQMDTFDAGQLPVPADQMSTYLAQQIGDERARQIGQWLTKLKHFEFDPIMKIEQGRRVWIENVTVTDTGYDLEVRILDRKQYRKVKRELASAR